MTGPRGIPAEPGDAAVLVALDRALDELAAGGDDRAKVGGAAGWAGLAPGTVSEPAQLPPGAVGEAADLAGAAAELQAAVPRPPPGAADRGRAAFLAVAGGSGRSSGRPWRPAGVRRVGVAASRRSLPLRVVALAAALVLLVAVPAVARQARPGSALWPVRAIGQQMRESLAGDPVRRAHLQLDAAGPYLAAAAGASEDDRKDLTDRAEDKVRDALDTLEDLAGPEAAAARARAERLLLVVEALERADDAYDRSGAGPGPGPGSGSGSGSEAGDDRSGRGGGDDRSGRGDDAGGSGSGDDAGGSGSSGSGSGWGSGGYGGAEPPLSSGLSRGD